MTLDTASYFSGRRVFVTGASGFVGSHLLERLVELGAEVTALVRYNSMNDIGLLGELEHETLSRVNIVFGDVRELDSLRRAMQGAETVLHLAALVSIPYSYIRPQDVVDVNVTGTLNALLASQETKAGRFVQVSSSEVYGSAIYTPIDERHPKQPQSVYSASKIAADAIALGFHHSYGLPVTICRPINTFGPRQSDRAVIPTIIAQALRAPTIRLGNTSTTRDFTYVDDTVEGIVRLAAADQAVGREINLGSGSEIAILELARRIGALLGTDIEVAEAEERLRPATSEVWRLLAANTAAREIAGWAPRVSLDEGLERTVAWIGRRGAMYDPECYRY